MIKEFFKNRFDFVCSIGMDCACTSYLRRCNLQQFSYPLDWLGRADMKARAELLANNFQGFMELKDLKPMEKTANNENEIKFDLYENTFNHLVFWHDFRANVPIEESIVEVKAKYNRRIKRLYEKIRTSKKALFVCLNHGGSENNTDYCYKILSEKFGREKTYLLVIENSKEPYEELSAQGHVLSLHYDTNSDDKKHKYNPTMGNKTNNLKIFKQIKLNLPLREKIKNILYKILIFLTGFIFIKKLRQNAKTKLNMVFFRAKL